MAKKLELKLRQKNGRLKTYTQDFIPIQKLIEAADLNDHILDYKNQVEWIKAKVTFVASVFDDPEVTPEALLAGVEARDALEVIDGTINEVMGLNDPNSTPAEKVQASPDTKSQSIN
ncbi:phage tail assembly chaperone G [Lacticaseibacillus saniviri]|uniref:Tail assembly chaperone n=1 Tax=Lacticaseibacillus saniviri JCM 17471 = DSM 24301 TaxID=1293598 RepID=A0A0R2MV79_9LACO|nr:hypothetical protein [Lacticaseibacillus saniviri]KRO17415.1 hypothetical protein IV56_GL000331 [Lacticaseibacillus saniviri JCM 17471 = DSM 24301]